MEQPISSVSFLWHFGTRLTWWGIRDGTIIGGLIGALVGASIMLLPIFVRAPISGLIQPAETTGAVFLALLFGAVLGMPIAAFSGMLVGLSVGGVTGLGLGILTWRAFFPLRDIPRYRHHVRSIGVLLCLITVVPSSLAVYRVFNLPYTIFVPMLAPPIACCYTWAVTPRLVRWYIYWTLSA
jgi:hypothetical protein